MATAIGSNEIVLLSEVVREQYVRYLERQLQENVNAWADTSRNHHKATAWACITHSVKAMETHAIKACQAAQLYQRAMVKMIAAVRRNTQERRLADTLFNQMQQQHMDEDVPPVEPSGVPAIAINRTDKATQTTSMAPDDGRNEINNSYTLGQKIDMFQSRLVDFEAEQQMNGKARIGTPVSAADDEVAQELAKLFDDEPPDLSAIFGIDVETMEDTDEPPQATEAPILLGSPATPFSLPAKGHSADLRNSRWPCELYAQRRRLNACLVRLLDADWRCEATLRYKFDMLFGEDSDDEFAAHISSPSIDLVDEQLLASCIFRIRPWIVRHLMPPLQEGLIANRFLFKKLARMLANSIVLVNPYPSEQQIKEAVEYLFCMQPNGVQSALDLETLPSVFVERFES